MAGTFNLRIFLLSVVFIGCLNLFGQNTNFLTVEVLKGDGISTILNRYNLVTYSCNVDSFLLLNNLKRNDHLILGKKYKLPIYVFEYDKNTIRSSTNISDFKLAITIQSYNKEMVEQGLKKSDYQIDNQLWVPLHFLHCFDGKYSSTASNTGQTPDKTSTVKLTEEEQNSNQSDDEVLRYEIFPIFGEKYKKTPIYSEKLKNQIFYLISGHGGPDPGAVAKLNDDLLCEDEYAYDITLRFARNLLQHGATVYVIVRDPDDGIRDESILKPDHDEVVWFKQSIPRNQAKRLKQRTNVVNDLVRKHQTDKNVIAQRVIEIHVDSRYQNEKVDIFFYHAPGSKLGKELANSMLTTIKEKYDQHQKGRGYRGVVKARDLHTLREVIPPAVYIELGNITNSFDQKRLLIVNNRQAIANWLTLGVMKNMVKD
jgi:N-acetylmuramoyl-L-alanine amidase